ncbi:MAG: hypothetical protein V5A18_08945, partial [Haloarculaceae archaeon]
PLPSVEARVGRVSQRSARSGERAIWRVETVCASGWQDWPTIRNLPSDEKVPDPGGLKGRTSLALV